MTVDFFYFVFNRNLMLILHFDRELRNLRYMKVTMIPIIAGTQGFRKETSGIENQSKNRNHPDHSTVEKGYVTEKRPGDLRRHTVTMIPLKDLQLILL